MVSVVFWPIKMGLALNAQVLPAEQAREIAPLKLTLGTELAMMVKVVCVEPTITGLLLPELGAVSAKAAPPIPDSATTCGLPVALSVMLKEPARLPLAVGENDTLMVQLWPTLRVFSRAPQVSVSVKSLLVPAEIFVIFNVAVPVLVTVTLWAGLTVPTGWLEKERLVGETVTAVAAVTPDPVKAM